jgi:HK97 gp10 family phage protein
MTVSVKIEGLSELAAGLLELKTATATNVQKRALIKAAEPIMNDAQAHAPVRTGTLQKSITVSAKLSPRQRATSPRESKVEIYIGPPSMPRAIVSEFGSVKESPRPFMRPAWDSNKAGALLAIKSILGNEIEKAAARAARKTARFLAKKGP